MVSQRLLSLNPTTVMVVLLLGLWLLLGCDNNPTTVMVVLLLELQLLLGCDNTFKDPTWRPDNVVLSVCLSLSSILTKKKF